MKGEPVTVALPTRPPCLTRDAARVLLRILLEQADGGCGRADDTTHQLRARDPEPRACSP